MFCPQIFPVFSFCPQVARDSVARLEKRIMATSGNVDSALDKVPFLSIHGARNVDPWG